MSARKKHALRLLPALAMLALVVAIHECNPRDAIQGSAWAGVVWYAAGRPETRVPWRTHVWILGGLAVAVGVGLAFVPDVAHPVAACVSVLMVSATTLLSQYHHLPPSEHSPATS